MADATFENNLPEMEETAPAPASALETAPTSNDVTDDITISHGDTQPITKTNIAESPAEDAGKDAPAGCLPGFGDLEADAVPLAHFIGAVSPMIPAYAVLVGASFPLCRDDLAQEIRAEFDGLSGEGRRLVEDIWAGGAANERLRADGVTAGRDQWRAWAQAAWRELTGREPDEGFDERFDRHPQDRCCELSFCEACNLMGRELVGREDAGRALLRAGVFVERARRECADSTVWSALAESPFRRYLMDLLQKAVEEKGRVDRSVKDADEALKPLFDVGGLDPSSEAAQEAVCVMREICFEGGWAAPLGRLVPQLKSGPVRDEIEAAYDKVKAARHLDAVADADPWAIADEIGPFIQGPDGLPVWRARDSKGIVRLSFPADAERAIFRALGETICVKGVPLKDDGEPDLAAMARFWVKAGEQYTVEWNKAKARVQGKNDPHKDEKDPALAIKWDKYPNAACAARIIRLARDAVGRPAKLVDGIIQYVSEQGLELAQNASNGKFIEGPLRDWALEINPSADERWIAATRINLYTTLERIDTRALAKQGKIDVNAWRICDGQWYFTSSGPHAFKMRRIDPTRVSDWAAQVEDGVHLKPVGEPDEEGWYAVAEPEDKEIMLPNESGEMVACRPSDLAKTWFPEDPEAGQDLLDQLIAYRIRPRNMPRMQGFAVLRGDGGDGKSLFREMNLTMSLGNRRAAERDAHFSGAGLEDMDDNDLVLSTVGAYVNWPADAAQDPVCSSKGWKFLKPMSCGESVTFKVKYAEALTTSAGSIPCIFPVNGTPRYPSYGASKKRRVFDIEFGHPIPEGKKIRRLMDVAMTDEEFVTWPWWHSVKAYSTFDDGFRPNRLSDQASRSAEAESDTLAQIAAGIAPLLCGHAWPLDLVYQLMQCWARTHMPNARLANMGPKLKRELERVLEPYGLRVLPKRQFRWKSWYDPEVMRTSVHSVCEPLIRRDQNGREIARDYKPASLANWVDDVELATQGREKVYGWVVRAEDWDLFEAAGSKQFDQHEVVWLDAHPEDGDEPVDDDGIEADSACDASLYDGVYLPILAGLAKAGCTALSGGPIAALPLERWLAAGGPCVPVVLSAGALKGDEARMLDDNPELQLGAPQALCGSPNGAVVALLPRSATGLLAPRADDPWLDPLALIVSGRAEIAAGNAPAVAPDPDPDDDPTPGPGSGAPEAPSIDPARDAEALRERGLTVEDAAPTSSDAPEGVKTPDETAAQGTRDDSAPADGAHEAPAPSGEDPAANGSSAPAETPVSAAPAAVEGGDAAEEASGAPDPGYEAFCAHAKGAVEHSGGYVVFDGGPEGTTVRREVIGEDEWAAYGRPTRVTRTVEVDGERLPLIE